MNVTELIKLSLKDAGVIGANDTPTSTEMDDGLTTLNQMIAVLELTKLGVYCQQQVTINNVNVQSYTVGAGGDINIDRPSSVDAMYWRLNDVDTQMRQIHSFEDYQKISIKNLESVPSAYYYRPDFPLGQLFVWPIPTNVIMVMTIKKPLPEYFTINDILILPKEYEAVLRFNLAVWLCSTYGLDVPPNIYRLATTTMKALKRQNNQIPTLQMPSAVLQNSRYNIYSGEGY